MVKLKSLGMAALLVSALCVMSAMALNKKATAKGEDATLSSDEMELINQGDKAVFKGHVLLEKTEYQLKANQMTRTEKTGLVEAEGNIIGMWKNPAGGNLKAYGDHGRYDPVAQRAELWTNLPKQVAVNWKDAKGSGNFLSDRAVIFVSSKSVRLQDHVTGHIVPAAQP